MGLIRKLLLYNYAFLALPDVLPNVCSSNRIITTLDYQSPKELYETQISDPLRRDFLFEATFTGLGFVLLHEAGHIARGHLQFLANQSGTNTLPELGVSRIAFNTRDLHALEVDADAYAAMTMLVSMVKSSPRSLKLSVDQIHLAKLFGIIVLFCILAEEDINHVSNDSRTHPEPATRTAMLLKHLLDGSGTMGDNSTTIQYDKIVNDCLKQVRRAWSHVRGDSRLAAPAQLECIVKLHDEVCRLEPQLIASAETRAMQRYGRI